MAQFCHGGTFLHKKYVCSCGFIMEQCPCDDLVPKDVVELECAKQHPDLPEREKKKRNKISDREII